MNPLQKTNNISNFLCTDVSGEDLCQLKHYFAQEVVSLFPTLFLVICCHIALFYNQGVLVLTAQIYDFCVSDILLSFCIDPAHSCCKLKMTN